MKRIKSIEVKNFKSLVDFKIDLAKFSCLIGLNGAGKSTVLQFIDFLSQLVRGDMEGWLKERQWQADDMVSKLTQEDNIEFTVRFMDDQGEPAGTWEAVYNPSESRCVEERIDMLDHYVKVDNDELISGKTPKDRDEVTGHILLSVAPKGSKIAFYYQGSVISQLKVDGLQPSIQEFKQLVYGITSLDLLAPELLRQQSKEASGSLGIGGQNLSAFLFEMGKKEDKTLIDLIKKLKLAYPYLLDLSANSLRSGRKQIEIFENYEGSEIEEAPVMITEARHINDGMLRLMAILAELQSDHRFLLFDEIENGINPELVEFVLNELVTTEKQVMVTTHSPMILNYLEDNVAREGVVYLYKDRMGHTNSIPFFDIPSLSEKLTVMGPGEAFVDTDLTALRDEIEAIPKG